MKRLFPAVGLFVILLAAAPAHAEAPSAADVEEARKYYARGVALYEQGADGAALAALERAYQLAPNWKLLYELGVVETALHDSASALKHFTQYLEEGADAVKPARQKEVSGYVAQLEQQVATIDVAVAPGAQIELDDVVVGTSPLPKGLVVNPGHHKLGAAKDGVASEKHALIVAGGEHARVELEIAPRAPPPSPPEPPPPQATAAPPPPPVLEPPPAPPPEVVPAPPRAPYPLWVGWTVTGALAAGAIATGVEALTTNISLTNAKNGPSTPDALSSLSSRAHTFALASDILTVAAVVTGVTNLYFELRRRRSATQSTSPTGVSPRLSVTVGLGSLGLRAEF